MTEAGGTTAIKQLTNVGDYTLWEISNTSVTDAETIAIPSTAPVTTSSLIAVVGALDETSENQLGDGEMTVEYTKATKLFTVSLSGLSDTKVRILFYVVNE